MHAKLFSNGAGLVGKQRIAVPDPWPSALPPKRVRGAVCFVGTLGDIMRGNVPESQPPDTVALVPSWLAWPLPFPRPPPNPVTTKAKLRQARAAAVRADLAKCKSVKPLGLPSSGNAVSDAWAVQPLAALAGGEAEQAGGVSNAVPFSGATAEAGTGRDPAGAAPEGQGPAVRAQAVEVVLPWLLAAAGKLDLASVECLASTLGLSNLHQLDVSKHLADGPRQTLNNGVCWVGPTSLPSPTVAAAAILHRMAHRRGGAAAPLLPIDGVAVVLCFLPHHVEAAAEVLALYLHLYCMLDAKDAVSAAGTALRCAAPSLTVIDERLEELAACAMGWLQRVVLTWRYGGGRVEAAGDAVGGWNRPVAMLFNVQQRAWRLQLWGLPPGTYACKYLVDGQWCVDVAAPMEVDAWGNRNNVVVVTGCLGTDAATEAAEDGDGMAALPAAAVAAAAEVAQAPLVVSEDAAAAASSAQVEEPARPAQVSMESAERLQLARFGAAVLALYTKSATIKRAARRRV